MNENLALKGIIIKLNNTLDELESLGYNVNDMRSRLNRIESKKVSVGDSLVEEMPDSNKLKSLEELTQDLQKYSDILNISRIINFLNLAGNDLSKEKVENARTLINLIRMNREKLNNNLLSKAYKSIYETIKMEFLIYFESDLLDIILDVKEDVMNIDALVEEDIRNLKQSTYVENRIVLNRLLIEESLIKAKEMNPSLVTETIIFLIVMCNNQSNMSKNASNELEYLIRNLSSNTRYTHNRDFYNQKDRLITRLMNISKISEEYKKKIISLLLSATLFGASSGLAPFLIKKISTTKVFNTTKETIELINGEYYHHTDNYYGKKVSEDKKLILREYGALIGSKRTFHEYKLKDVIKETKEDYLNIDINSPGVEEIMLKDTFTKYYDDDEEFYLEFLEGYRELTIIDQDLSDKHINYNKTFHHVSLVAFYIVLLISSFTIIGPINNLISVLKKKSEYEDEINEKDRIKEIIENYIDTCKLKTEENKELKKKLNIILSSGILDLNDEELKSKIKSLLSELEHSTISSLDELLMKVEFSEHQVSLYEEDYKKLELK